MANELLFSSSIPSKSLLLCVGVELSIVVMGQGIFSWDTRFPFSLFSNDDAVYSVM